MQKVYLLLRDNQQNGPYNLNEILQFDLKPIDLIWIEGKSAGWYYPQEIEELKPHLSFVKPEPETTTTSNIYSGNQMSGQVSATKIFVSMPMASATITDTPKPVQQRNEAFYAATVPHNSETDSSNTDSKLTTVYAKSLEEVESDFTNWNYNQKLAKTKKDKTRKKLTVAAVMVAAGLMAFAAITHFSKEEEQPVKQTEIAATPLLDSAARQSEAIVNSKAAISGNKKKAIKKAMAWPVKQIKTPIAQLPKNKNVITTPSVSREMLSEKAVIKEPDATANESKEAAAKAPEEKKKKLRDKFLDLFKKKEPQKREEAKGTENENGERRSVHRQSDASLAEQVRIKFTVPNDWMIGIKGAKISLTNKSNQNISKATVEVLYYDENNELLQTKTVSFNKINAGETATIAIPDQSTADHLEYKIISVLASGDPLASM